jgi:lactoylglutathione lyase
MKSKIHSSLKVLLVSNLKVSMSFYKEVMGCEVTEWWAIRDGFSGLGIKLIQAGIKEDVRPNGIAGEKLRPIPDIYCYVENWNALDELYKEFKRKGAKVVIEPWIDQDGGPWKEFAVVDPDNYCIAFGGTNNKKVR